MTSIILRTATRFLMPLLLLFALFLLLRGHNEPGGGFVAGLVVSAAFVLYSIDSGIPACRRALLVNPSRLLGIGLLIALASGFPALVIGRPYMTALWTSIGVPPATFDETTVDIEASRYLFRAKGSVPKFAGWMVVYNQEAALTPEQPRKAERAIPRLATSRG